MNRSNGFDTALLEGFLRDIDEADERLASPEGEYMEAWKGPRQDIADVYEAVKERGLPVKSFRTYVKNRRLERQKGSNVQKLDLDQQADYKQMAEALGELSELPLGQAALAAHPGAPTPAEEALDALTQ